LKPKTKNRNAQFENIIQLTVAFNASGIPIVSMDIEKKEYLGNFYREVHLYTLEELQSYDHDFNRYVEGVIAPHKIYVLKDNVGYIQLGTKHDTSEFACDGFRHLWYTFSCQDYPTVTAILVHCDGSGSNSSRHYLCKQDLQALADEIGIENRIAYYLPSGSNYNPIEHRFFPHDTRTCQGLLLTSIK
jgi:hypothetical protein